MVFKYAGGSANSIPSVLVWNSVPEEECFVHWKSRDNAKSPAPFPAGDKWARHAQAQVLSDLEHMSLEKLMVCATRSRP